MNRIYPKLIFNKKYFEKVLKNKIRNTRSKGLDKQSLEKFLLNKDQNFNVIAIKCLSQSYKFTPYLEVLKLKGSNSLPRTISIPCIRDRFVLYALMDVLHSKFPESVNRKLPNRHINDLKAFIDSVENPIHFLKIDIKKFYDTIDRTILIKILQQQGINKTFLFLIKQAIETPTIPPHIKKEEHKKYKKEKGIPQGLPISNILAQIYLSEFDKMISRRSFFYQRYVDDILFLNEGEISSYRIKNIDIALNKINLESNQEKTAYGPLTKGFTYLSYRINDQMISISEKSVQIFIRRIAAKFTWYKNGLVNKNMRPDWLEDDERFKEVFLEELNEHITGSISMRKNYGWIFYFLEMTDRSLLFKIDKIIADFFQPLATFQHTAPSTLKRLVRTYYVIKHNKGIGYLNNYDMYNTVRKKRNYLIFRGALAPTSIISNTEIDKLFEKFKNKMLKNLEKDVSYRYF